MGKWYLGFHTCSGRHFCLPAWLWSQSWLYVAQFVIFELHNVSSVAKYLCHEGSDQSDLIASLRVRLDWELPNGYRKAKI